MKHRYTIPATLAESHARLRSLLIALAVAALLLTTTLLGGCNTVSREPLPTIAPDYSFTNDGQLAWDPFERAEADVANTAMIHATRPGPPADATAIR